MRFSVCMENFCDTNMECVLVSVLFLPDCDSIFSSSFKIQSAQSQRLDKPSVSGVYICFAVIFFLFVFPRIYTHHHHHNLQSSLNVTNCNFISNWLQSNYNGAIWLNLTRSLFQSLLFYFLFWRDYIWNYDEDSSFDAVEQNGKADLISIHWTSS